MTKKQTEIKFKETEIGLIPEDWEVKELGEIADVLTGFPFESNKYSFEEGTLVVRGENLSERVFRWDTPKRWPNLSSDLKKYLLEANVVVVSMDGNVGKNKAVVKENNLPLLLAQRVARIKTKKGISQDYINQAILSDLFLRYCEQIRTGTTISHISKTQIEKFKVPLPPLPEQRAIAKILSDLDAKIEHNQQMNKTLEAIGQAIFKRWFIDFEFPNEEGKPYKSSGGEMVYNEELGKEIPKGWKVGMLKDILNNVKIPLNVGDGLKDRVYVPIDLLSIKKIGLDSYLPYTEAKSSLIAFEKNDILVGAMRIYFHRVCLSPFAGITRTTTFVLRAKNENFLAYSLFVLNQDSTIDYANSHSNGSTMPYAVWDGSLSDMRIVIPDETTLKKFNNLLRPILNKIRDTIFEQITLSSIRDALLPKLMSGKIRVPIDKVKT